MDARATSTVSASSFTFTRRERRQLVGGLVLFVFTIGLGFIAKASTIARWSLHVDQHIAAHDRTSALTSVAKLFTNVATPEVVGAAAVVLVPVALVVMRRRSDAFTAFAILGGALVATIVLKSLVGEARPPESLWAMHADSGASFPSGHATVAGAIFVACFVVARARSWRIGFAVVGIVFALAVSVSRVYLGNHFPLDVVGGLLVAISAGLVVSAFRVNFGRFFAHCAKNLPKFTRKAGE